MKIFLLMSILLFSCLLHADNSFKSNEEMIVLMEHFDPLEWSHVHVNFEKIDEVADDLLKIDQLKIADWAEILPRGLEIKECVEYIIGLICIDFCHWDFSEEKGIRNFYIQDRLGNNLRGIISNARQKLNFL